MRFIICFTIFLTVACVKNHFSREEEFKKVHKECQSDSATHVDEDFLEKFRDGEDKNLGLHIFCMNTKLNIQEKDGEINKDQIKRDLQDIYHTPGVINDIVEECGTSEGKTKYDVAINVYKCLHKYAIQDHNKNYHEKREHEYKKAAKECHSNEETDAVNKEEVKKFFAYGSVDDSPKKVIEYVHCVAKKVKIVHKYGDLNKQVVKQDLQDSIHDENLVKRIIKRCSAITNEHKAAQAAEIFQCIYKDWLEFRCHDRNEKFMKFVEECQPDPAAKVDRTVIERLVIDGKEINITQEDHRVVCLIKKLGFQLENGDINKESIKNFLKSSYFEEDKITKVSNDCAVKNKGDSELVTAIKIFRCLDPFIGRDREESMNGPYGIP